MQKCQNANKPRNCRVKNGRFVKVSDYSTCSWYLALTKHLQYDLQYDLQQFVLATSANRHHQTKYATTMPPAGNKIYMCVLANFFAKVMNSQSQNSWEYKNPLWTEHRNPLWTEHRNPFWTKHKNPLWTEHKNPIWSEHKNPFWTEYKNPLWTKHRNRFWTEHRNPI